MKLEMILKKSNKMEDLDKEYERIAAKDAIQKKYFSKESKKVVLTKQQFINNVMSLMK